MTVTLRRSSPWSALLTALLLSACTCGDGGGGDGGTGADGGGEDGRGDCVVLGGSCAAGEACCGNAACLEGTCQETCRAAGEACSTGTECCFNVCLQNGTCASQCAAIGGACSAPTDCCTGNCGSNGQCADIPDRPLGEDGGVLCQVRGEACTNDATCCSTNCTDGICQPAYTCGAHFDVCGFDSQCCSTKCSVNDGGVGFCEEFSGEGSPGCTPPGNPCRDFTECCTAVCADLGTGATVCQPVSGCQVAGNPCTSDEVCCGSGSTVTNVQCRNADPDAGITSTCDNGTTCRAPGTICGKPVYPDGGYVQLPDGGGDYEVNHETNCCDGYRITGVEQTCRLDRTNVPRCFGGGSAQCPGGYTGEAGCCIADGEYCEFRDQCCNGALCLAGEDGTRRCTLSSCLQVGAECDPTSSGCCNGTQCLATSEITYACQAPSDGGSCLANGASCSSGGSCCSGICDGTCQAPTVCQPEGSSCSVSGDCCSGLSCQTPTGGGAGTCVSGSTCSSAGQSCSPTSLCCNEGTELACLSTSGTACDGTTACACEFILN